LGCSARGEEEEEEEEGGGEGGGGGGGGKKLNLVKHTAMPIAESESR
jgi:hypothetical protein